MQPVDYSEVEKLEIEFKDGLKEVEGNPEREHELRNKYQVLIGRAELHAMNEG